MAVSKTEDVVAEAAQVFLRYGYKRVTMADLAKAAHMSRPALYLVFSSKEEIFTAVMARVFTSMLAEIDQGIHGLSMAQEKLTLACEVWCVRPFEMILASPDARDLLESSYEFAAETTTQAANDFTKVLAEILEPLVRHQKKVRLSSAQIARLLASALPGFKAAAQSVDQLRTLIAGLITVFLASLQEGSALKKHKKRNTQNKDVAGRAKHI